MTNGRLLDHRGQPGRAEEASAIPSARLMLGDCLDRMGEIADSSIDAIVTDPPYPCIKRPYGTWTEAEWWELMMGVCRESRRVLKPTGSAVFVLQPNSRKVGSMRGWLWRFMAWACDEWNMVQDAWWWNSRAMVEAHAIQGRLMRPSIKACVWCGPEDCYRDQDEILWGESEATKARKASERANGGHTDIRRNHPSGQGSNRLRMMSASDRRGGVTPYNLIIADHGRSQDSAGAAGHPAGTPFDIADWWVRYISPSSGVVCDPFMGSGTVGLAALNRGRSFVGIERDPGYFAVAERRIAEARAVAPLFSFQGRGQAE